MFPGCFCLMHLLLACLQHTHTSAPRHPHLWCFISPVWDTVILQFDHVLFISSQRQYASSTYPYANLSPPVQSNEVSNGLVCMAMVHLWIHMIVLCPTGISWSGQTVLKSLCPEQGNFFLLRLDNMCKVAFQFPLSLWQLECEVLGLAQVDKISSTLFLLLSPHHTGGPTRGVFTNRGQQPDPTG